MSATTLITKAVILARGLGKRMREEDSSATIDAAQAAAADSGVKAMVPVRRPFLDYVLSGLADAGFDRACIVIGPEYQTVRDYYTHKLRLSRIEVSFATQPKPLGTANAVLAAQDFVGTDEFLVVNSDNYYPLDVLQALQRLGQPGAVLFEAGSLVRNSNIPENRIHAFAGCVVDSAGFLAGIVEKPAIGDLDAAKLISMNCWRFSAAIFAACRDVPLSRRGEYELPLAVKLAIKHGMRLKVEISHSGVLDLSRRSDIAAVAERLWHVKAQL